MESLDKIREHLKTVQNNKRYIHSLGVEKVAAELGNTFGLNDMRIRTAALLHDIGKNMNYEEQIDFARVNGISLVPDDLLAKGVIHSILGSHIARRDFHIDDNEILDAIRYHTTGRAGMTLFQKVVFAADYLDPGRGFRNERDLDALVRKDFEAGLLEIIKDKIAFVVRKGEHLHPLSVEFYNSQLELVRIRK